MKNATSTHNQQGAILLVTLILLTVMTLVGLASTQDNRMQAMMVRNNQFQTEVFNTSYNEIDAQIDVINNDDNIPQNILTLISNGINTELSSATVVPQMAALTGNSAGISKIISKTYHADCNNSGNSAGVGLATTNCFNFRLQVTAAMNNSPIHSDQYQIYSYSTPALN